MRSKRVVTIVLFLTIFLGSCNATDFNGSAGGGGGTTGSTPPVSQQTPAALTTSAEGASAASLILQSKELLMTSTNLSKNLGFISQSQMVTAASGTGSGACADYGTYDYTRTYSGGQYSMVYTFSLCRENDFQYDGGLVASGTPALMTVQMAGLKILNFKNNYTTLIGSLVASNSFKMAGTGNAVNGSYTITMNGSMAAFDYYTLGQHTMTYTALVSGFAVTTDGVTNIRSTNVTANGKYSVQRASRTTITYQGFSVNTQKQLATNIEDVSISGRLITDITPNSGLEGVFDVTTVTPIRTVPAPYPPTTTQGTLTTNGTAIIQYGAANTIDVSVAGDITLNYAKEFMLMKLGDFYGMEQQLPIVSGTTGIASGSIMSISALSTGPALDCYTDVHVSYFLSTAPTATIPKWYVHWASGLSSCVPQAGIPYQEATSSTGVATDPCDVGLDINGQATDITSGGVEHFLAAALPTGYYILSINNYSCATSVANDATILVGDYLFGPYHCTYSAVDGDGSTPGAWCRLADIRVNAGGVIDVLAPNGAIPPWHP